MPFIRSAEAKSATAYYRAGAVAPNRIIPYQWLSLAIDRLRKELGSDDIAVMPVMICLNTALGYCQDMHD